MDRTDEIARENDVICLDRLHKVCEVCQYLQESHPVTWEKQDLVPRICPYLDIVLQALNRLGFENVEGITTSAKGLNQCPFLLVSVRQSSEAHTVSTRLFLSDTANSPNLSAIFGTSRAPQVLQSISERLKLARGLARECYDSHSACHPPFEPTFPKRIIDIHSSQQTQSVRLLDVEDTVSLRPTTHPYACLSYCWGNVLPFRATKCNLPELKEGIPLVSLPKTLQDAIQTACYLEIDYLWIDALCIIQDDLSDWEEQSARMFEIYGSACLTIAASRAADCSAGFLHEGIQIWSPPVKIYYDEGDGISTHVYAQSYAGDPKDNTAVDHACYGHSTIDEDTDPDKFIIKHPLSSRGWAFQESAISPRILKFGVYEIEWQCNVSSKCECQLLLQDYSTPKKELDRVIESSGKNRARFSEIWNRMLVTYSLRRFTNEKDRLVALSGISSAISSKTGMRSIAGLWRETLLQGLQWSPVSTRPVRWDRQVHLAPSWSWASLPSGRLEDYASDEVIAISTATVLDVQCRHTNLDGKGPVTEGVLKLEAHVSLVRMKSVLMDASGDPSSQGSSCYYILEFTHGQEFLNTGRGLQIEFKPDLLPPDGDQFFSSTSSSSLSSLERNVVVILLGFTGRATTHVHTTDQISIFDCVFLVCIEVANPTEEGARNSLGSKTLRLRRIGLVNGRNLWSTTRIESIGSVRARMKLHGPHGELIGGERKVVEIV